MSDIPSVDPTSWIGQLTGVPAGALSGVSPQLFLQVLQDIARGLNGLRQSNYSGLASALNLTAATVIKASAGRLRTLIILAPGTTSGAWTFNDCATVGAAAVSNEIFTLAYNDAARNIVGGIITIDFPFQAGLVLSAVPGAGSPVAVVAYD